MAFDFRIDPATGDMVGGYVTGQDEILQRVQTRLFRYLGEWAFNTSVGLPWYDGQSDLLPGTLTRENGILGSRDFNRAELLIRNEIAETEGVIRIVNFSAKFDNATREFRVTADIATEFGVGSLNQIMKATA